MKKEVNTCNIIFAVCVIIIHLLSELVTQGNENAFLLQRFFAFAVTGFVFLSGFKLFINYRERPYKKFIHKRFVTIYVPYLIVSSLYYLYFVVRGFTEGNLREYLFQIFTGSVCAHLYFVVLIMQFYVFFPLFAKFVNKCPAKIGVVSSIAVTAILKVPALQNLKYADRIFIFYLCFFIMGAYAAKNYDRFIELLNRYKWRLALFWLCVGVLLQVCRLEVVNLFFCLSSVLLVYLLCLKIKADFSEASGVAYYVYLIHPFFIYCADYGFYHLGIFDITQRFILRVLIVFLCSFGFPLYIRKKFTK
ncbi:acyltransferase [Clostridia bacterium]|nr:acyltransferase [Clostridia bacterium]